MYSWASEDLARSDLSRFLALVGLSLAYWTLNRAERVRAGVGLTSATIEQLERGNALLRRELWR
jgi:hypothetical protein